MCSSGVVKQNKLYFTLPSVNNKNGVLMHIGLNDMVYNQLYNMIINHITIFSNCKTIPGCHTVYRLQPLSDVSVAVRLVTEINMSFSTNRLGISRKITGDGMKV